MKEVKIYFTKAKDYKIAPANGAWGGITPQGDIAVDFYIEKGNIPDSLNYTIDEKTKEIKEEKREGNKQIRELQYGLLIRPDIAYIIGKWLIKKAEQAGLQELNDEDTE